MHADVYDPFDQLAPRRLPSMIPAASVRDRGSTLRSMQATRPAYHVEVTTTPN